MTTKMGAGNLLSRKNSNNKRRLPSVRRRGSDESDEDYVFNEEEEEDEEEYNEPKGFLVVSSDEDTFTSGVPRAKKRKRSIGVSRSKVEKEDDLGRETTRVRRRVSRAEVSEDEEDCDFNVEDEEDGDDEEFRPNEIDFADEEEELRVQPWVSVTKKKRTPAVKNRKRKKSSKAVRKPLKKKRRRVVVNPPMSSDDDFDADFTAVRKRSRKKSSKRRNKSSVEESDSDFDLDSDVAASEPSDVKYTIYDEERELLREASSFIGSSTTRGTRKPPPYDEERELLREASSFIGSSTTRGTRKPPPAMNRRVDVVCASNSQHPKPTRRKGKEKAISAQDDTGKQTCGICFSEEGKGVVRGTLNCCSHYFCFACITEWSKVESKCPLCKQRFETISKPARSNLGVSLRDVVIQVPKRDQIYQPSEEELMGYLDPYDGVVCIECQLGGDDGLMLLCDICDSPAHTYCVGLGREVPEGNWYCRGCRIADPGSTNTQVQDPTQGSSIGSIPANPRALGINVDFDPAPSDPLLMHGIGISPSPTPVPDDHLASPSGLGVSTLSGRRRIHHRIRNLLSNNRMNQRMGNDMNQRMENDIRSVEENVESQVVADSDDDEQIRKPTTQLAGTSSFHSVFHVWDQDGNDSSMHQKDRNSTYLTNLRRANVVVTDSSSEDELERRSSVLSRPLHCCSSGQYNQAGDG